MCRKPFTMSLAAPAGGAAGGFVSPPLRVEALLAQLRGVQAARDEDATTEVLTVLGAFVESSPELCMAALSGGALEAICGAMCDTPLCIAAQLAGCAAIASLTDNDAPGLSEACAASASHVVVLHALRSLAGGIAALDPDGDALGPALHATWNHLRRNTWPRGLGAHGARALARLFCRTRRSSGAIALPALSALTQLTEAPGRPHIRAWCAPLLIREIALMLRLGTDDDMGSARVAHHVLRTLLVEDEHMDADDSSDSSRRGVGSAAQRNAEEHSAFVAVALEAGVLQPLLARLERLADCTCEKCADFAANHVLPLVRVLCVASPAALLAALHTAGLMRKLAIVAAAAHKFPQLTVPLCELLSSCMPLPPLLQQLENDNMAE
jgi:hypothetical protein